MSPYKLILVVAVVLFIRYIIKAVSQAWKKSLTQKSESLDQTLDPLNPSSLPGVPDNAPPVTMGYVLVANKSQTIRTSIRMLLQPLGFGILESETGSRAWKTILNKRPGLVITDTKLSGMNGYQLAKKMLSDSKTRDIPIILLTGVKSKDPKAAVLKNVRFTIPRQFSSEKLMLAVAHSTTSITENEESSVCPVCENVVDGKSRICPNCGAIHHRECFELNFGCGRCDYEQ